MSIPFEIPIINQDVVNGVSYAGSTLTLTRAEGSDLTTTIATSDPTKIEDGTSSMEITSEDGDCVFTPAGVAANATTFAADGNVGIGDTSPTGGKLCVNGTTYLNGDSGNGGGLRITRNTYATPGEREWLISNHISVAQAPVIYISVLLQMTPYHHKRFGLVQMGKLIVQAT